MPYAARSVGTYGSDAKIWQWASYRECLAERLCSIQYVWYKTVVEVVVELFKVA